MMVGLPASGKSTKAKELAIKHNAIIHSSDALREELHGDENAQSDNPMLFRELHRRIKDDLSKGNSVIYDATNTNHKRRASFLLELKHISCEKICYVMAIPYKQCIERNRARERKVPEEVIKRMYMNFNVPYWYEGWDEIRAVLSDKQDTHLFRTFATTKDFNQDNPHHTLNLDEHCIKANYYVTQQDNCNDKLYFASLFHDIGKVFTKSFLNSKNEVTHIAHYYNHENCGAYDSLIVLGECGYKKALDVAIIIQWHMQPYSFHSEKTINKYKKLWGENLFNDIMLIHEADKFAH